MILAQNLKQQIPRDTAPLKNTFNETSILFQKVVQFSQRSDQGKVGKTPVD